MIGGGARRAAGRTTAAPEVVQTRAAAPPLRGPLEDVMATWEDEIARHLQQAAQSGELRSADG
jgi:hypothetical protein